MKSAGPGLVVRGGRPGTGKCNSVLVRGAWVPRDTSWLSTLNFFAAEFGFGPKALSSLGISEGFSSVAFPPRSPSCCLILAPKKQRGCSCEMPVFQWHLVVMR